ncbi:hypothetical protein [Rhodovulum strictum]|uniref:VPLPA-CTERM protein sorting domain-containing protein n=2 Tax=Rhodovulum strictum TaxID=58314 RepID=A0A844BIJ4_9RHOB|nr:hypothetical protein [Rhodovulum strictum]MRH20882.1 hypothetical protein [Rhodovulum strictum]
MLRPLLLLPVIAVTFPASADAATLVYQGSPFETAYNAVIHPDLSGGITPKIFDNPTALTFSLDVDTDFALAPETYYWAGANGISFAPLASGGFHSSTWQSANATLTEFTFDDGDWTHHYSNFFFVEFSTDVSANITSWWLFIQTGAIDYDLITASSTAGDHVRSYGEYSYSCPPDPDCVVGDASVAMTAQPGMWFLFSDETGDDFFTETPSVVSAPLPASWFGLLAALGGLAALRRRA